MRIAFYTLGCKVNQYETQILTEIFSAAGYDIADAAESAEVYVVNSCTVTAAGDQKTRRLLRRLKAQSPGARLVLTGCFPQAFPDAAERLPEADVITGTRDRRGLLRLVERSLATGERIVEILPHEKNEAFEPMRAEGAGRHTRAFVKIEDGCERYCAYCIIPTARGPVRSKPPDELESELRALAAAGYREAVLAGINLSCYGKELGLRLADAAELACRVEGLERVRLGSLEPELLEQTDIDRLAALPRLCPQFHLSLQSGSARTLARMRRHYTPEEYARIAARLRERFPGCALTTDVMVGFPGETEEEFAESLAFVEAMGFARVHVFAYSRRPGTSAAALPGQLSGAQKTARAARMSRAAERTREAFLRAQLGKTVSVLFEHSSTPGMGEGCTANYTMVRVPSEQDLRWSTLPVRLTGIGDDCCTGVLEAAAIDKSGR